MREIITMQQVWKAAFQGSSVVPASWFSGLGVFLSPGAWAAPRESLLITTGKVMGCHFCD